jgi:hypothetical protein
MKKIEFSEAQILKILGEVGAVNLVREVCTAHGQAKR